MHEPVPAIKPRRTVWVVVATVAIVAAFLAWRLIPWRGREPADPEVVATYLGGTVTRLQIMEHFQALPATTRKTYSTMDGLKAVVDDLVIDVVLPAWAQEKQVDQKETFKEAMKHAREEIQISDVSEQLHQGRIQVGEAEIQEYFDLNREAFAGRPLVEVKEAIRKAIVEQKETEFVIDYLKNLRERASLQVDYSLLEVPEPAEQEVAAYYQANRDRFRITERLRVSQIRVDVSLAGGDQKARAQAESARARIAAGEDFALVARELGDGPEKVDGGEITQPVALGSRGAAFDEAVAPLVENGLSPVFKADEAYYVVKVLQRWPQAQKPYEAVRTEIAGTLRAEGERKVYAERAGQTLFTIHSRRTTLGEFLQELGELSPEERSYYSGAAGIRKILDALIDRLLIVEDAAEQAVDVKREGDIEHARVDLLSQVLHQEEVDERLQVSEKELRSEYERNRRTYAEPPRVKVRYIRVSRGETGDEDQKALARIKEAENKVRQRRFLGLGAKPLDFAEAARQYSEDPQTAAKGGELDQWLGETSGALDEMLYHTMHEALLPLKVGQISPVVPLGDSYYLFQVREKMESRQLSFEEAEPAVRHSLEVRRHEELSEQMSRRLRERMQVRVFDGRLRTVLNEITGQPPTTGP